MLDWEPIEPGQLGERFLDFPTVERLFAEQAALAALVLEHLDRAVALELPDLSAGTATVPFAEFVNSIERNTARLLGADAVAGTRPAVRWRGGLHDARRISYDDVNRWHESLRLLRLFVMGLVPAEFETGAWETGGHLELQMLGIA